MYKCEKCNKEFKNLTGLKCHTETACNKNINHINHICPKCDNYIKNSVKKHINCCDGNGTRRNKKNSVKISRLGKTNVEFFGEEKANDISKKISQGLMGKIKIITEERENIRRCKIRIKILERYANGWEVKCGRCKKIDYHSEIAGDVKLDGSWELATAKYLDKLGVKWIRNKKRFKYWNYIKNSESSYCPDFFVEEWDKYIEVKGYKTELDEIKWKQFKYNLEIWNKEKLKSLNIKI